MEVDIGSAETETSSLGIGDVKVTTGLMDTTSESSFAGNTEVATESMDIKSEPSTSLAENKSKLGLCEVCAFHDAKYTCPKCEVKTCSLRCNKIHKLEVECDGSRDRTKFIPMNKFTNLDLSSDFRLMEEITRSLEAARKEFGGVDETPKCYYKLRKAAYQRKTMLKLLPHKFERRKHNTSYFNFRRNIIFWHIEWIFVNADNLMLQDRRVSENERLSSALSKHLLKQEDECLQEKLQFYQAANIPGIKLYMKAERRPGKKFYELDPTLTIMECLERKIIIEFPTIHVVLKDHGLSYNVIDSDDEDMEVEGHVKSGNEVVQGILKRAESNESLYKSFKNLLFLPDNSDMELSADEEQ